MFIKIKLEPKNKNANESQKGNSTLNFIELSNNATIHDVKEQVELFVGIPAEEQVIKNITETLLDHERLCNVCDLENKEGIALLLYEGDEKFVCFLQLYNDTETAKQRKFQERSMSPSYYKNMPSANITSVNLIEDTDIEESSSGSDDSCDDTDNSTSSSGTDTNTDETDENNNKKRVLKQDRKSMPAKKRLFSLQTQAFLDELPSYSEGVITPTMPINTETINTNHSTVVSDHRNKDIPIKIKSITPNNGLNSSANLMSTVFNSEKEAITSSASKQLSCELNEASTSRPLINQTKTTDITASLAINKPCASIAPDIRKFIVIVTTSNCQEFLKTCAFEFERSSSASSLQFDDKLPIVLHSDGNLWITCKDEYTFAWVLTNIKSSSNLINKIDKLIHYYEYRKYIVVVPKFQCRSRSLYEQFTLLEHQNTNLNTEKWIVEQQHTIEDENDEFFDRSISVLCQNEVLFLLIDLESEVYIKGQDFKLKYCFWKILFQIRNT